MYKKSFNTIKESPIILLWFALPVLLTFLAVIPMLSGINTLIQAESTGISEAHMITFMANYMVSFVLIMFISLLSTFLIMPPVLNRIYETCTGIRDGGWYKRGLKRSWWKIFVTQLIVSAVTSMLGFVIVFAMFIPFVGILAYIAVILAISVTTIIAHTSVIAEDDFGTGLSNIFNIGFRYFFNQLGALALVNVPTFLMSIALGVTIWIRVINLSQAYTNAATAAEIMSAFMPIVWVFIAVVSLYTVFSKAFAYAYSINSYADKKAQLNNQ